MGLPEPIVSYAEQRRRTGWRNGVLMTVGVGVAYTLLSLMGLGCPFSRQFTPHGHDGHEMCDQAAPLYPTSINTSALTWENKDRLVQWLAGAVKVPTEVFDDMGDIGVDDRWEVFSTFADYLETAFPLVHQRLTRTRVHTHALVYEWTGTDASAKPLLLTAHQDVVPVLPETRGAWTHDPYGGEYDGTRIWGRGSMDDKSGLVGSLAAVELLLAEGTFVPRRTVILALGYDEESGGKGARYINDWLLDKYGPDSMSLLIDEGAGMSSVYGQMFALPGVAEKGYLDAEVRIETPGGHSSVPPTHTGIGLMSLVLAQLEAHPYQPELRADSPLVDFVACAARHAPEAPKHLRKDIGRVVRSRDKGTVDKKALAKVQDWWTSSESEDAGFVPPGIGRALISTTQAIDIIRGGVKVNALPEVVTAVVNHRISIASSVGSVQDRMTRTLAPVAQKHGLELVAWGKSGLGYTGDKPNGKLILDVAWNATIETAPVSPFTTDSAAWRLLAGTVKGTWNTRPGAGEAGNIGGARSDDQVHMAPLMSTGNTDTKNYWNVTRNIYRFAYLTFGPNLNNAHTVNEYIDADAFVEQARWFVNLILNVDASREV